MANPSFVFTDEDEELLFGPKRKKAAENKKPSKPSFEFTEDDDALLFGVHKEEDAQAATPTPSTVPTPVADVVRPERQAQIPPKEVDAPERWQNVIPRTIGSWASGAVNLAGQLTPWATEAALISEDLQRATDEIFPAPASKQSLDQDVAAAQGFVDTAKAYARNPMGTAYTVAEQIAQSIGPMRAFGVVGGSAAVEGGAAGKDAITSFQQDWRDGVIQQSPEYQSLAAELGQDEAYRILLDRRVRYGTAAAAGAGGLLAGAANKLGLNVDEQVLAGSKSLQDMATNLGSKFAKSQLGEQLEEQGINFAGNVVNATTGGDNTPFEGADKVAASTMVVSAGQTAAIGTVAKGQQLAQRLLAEKGAKANPDVTVSDGERPPLKITVSDSEPKSPLTMEERAAKLKRDKADTRFSKKAEAAATTRFQAALAEGAIDLAAPDSTEQAKRLFDQFYREEYANTVYGSALAEDKARSQPKAPEVPAPTITVPDAPQTQQEPSQGVSEVVGATTLPTPPVEASTTVTEATTKKGKKKAKTPATQQPEQVASPPAAPIVTNVPTPTTVPTQVQEPIVTEPLVEETITKEEAPNVVTQPVSDTNTNVANAQGVNISSETPSVQEAIVTPPTQPVKSEPEQKPAPKLPKALASAKPRYAFGTKQFSLSFENDIDKAAYIIAQDKPSKSDAQYLQFVVENTGLSEVEAREYGKRVKAQTKELARTTPAPEKPGAPLAVPSQPLALPAPKQATPPTMPRNRLTPTTPAPAPTPVTGVPAVVPGVSSAQRADAKLGKAALNALVIEYQNSKPKLGSEIADISWDSSGNVSVVGDLVQLSNTLVMLDDAASNRFSRRQMASTSRAMAPLVTAINASLDRAIEAKNAQKAQNANQQQGVTTDGVQRQEGTQQGQRQQEAEVETAAEVRAREGTPAAAPALTQDRTIELTKDAQTGTWTKDQVTAAVDSTLSDAEKAEAAADLGFKKWGKRASEKFYAGMMDYIVSGKAATKKLASLFAKVATDLGRNVLRAALIVSLTVNTMGNNSTVIASNQVVEQQQTEQVATPTAEFGNITPSQDVRTMADWVVANNDNVGMPFILADKKEGSLYFFSPNGTAENKAPALFGRSPGDVAPDYRMDMTLAEIRQKPQYHITPAGRFETATDDSRAYGEVVPIAKTGKNSRVSIHKVFTGRPQEQRMERLDPQGTFADDPLRARISLGCINVDPQNAVYSADFFRNGGVVYVLPETPEGMGVFEGFAALQPEAPTMPEGTDVTGLAGTGTGQQQRTNGSGRRRRPEGEPESDVDMDVEPTTIDVDGVQRPTLDSTGKRIHPTDEGVRNFWRWFGDSKVVDENGRPLTVYHGTAWDITEFRTDSGYRFGPGAYFTPDRVRASAYANDKFGGERRGANVLPTYVSIKNPLTDYEFDELPGTTYDQKNAEARRLGYDGIVKAWRNGALIVEVVAFNSSQVKSASGNSGAFSPDTGEIDMAAGQQAGDKYTSKEEFIAELSSGFMDREAQAFENLGDRVVIYDGETDLAAIDPKVAAAVDAAIAKQGASGRPLAFQHRGKVYFDISRINKGQAKSALLHEALVHLEAKRDPERLSSLAQRVLGLKKMGNADAKAASETVEKEYPGVVRDAKAGDAAALDRAREELLADFVQRIYDKYKGGAGLTGTAKRLYTDALSYLRDRISTGLKAIGKAIGKDWGLQITDLDVLDAVRFGRTAAGFKGDARATPSAKTGKRLNTPAFAMPQAPPNPFEKESTGNALLDARNTVVRQIAGNLPSLSETVQQLMLNRGLVSRETFEMGLRQDQTRIAREKEIIDYILNVERAAKATLPKYRQAAYSSTYKVEMAKYLRGDKSVNLPKPVKEALDDVRWALDKQALEAIALGEVAKADIPKVIRNLGKYTHTAYAAYHFPPGYWKQLMTTPGKGGVTPAQNLIESVMDEIIADMTLPPPKMLKDMIEQAKGKDKRGKKVKKILDRYYLQYGFIGKDRAKLLMDVAKEQARIAKLPKSQRDAAQKQFREDMENFARNLALKLMDPKGLAESVLKESGNAPALAVDKSAFLEKNKLQPWQKKIMGEFQEWDALAQITSQQYSHMIGRRKALDEFAAVLKAKGIAIEGRTPEGYVALVGKDYGPLDGHSIPEEDAKFLKAAVERGSAEAMLNLNGWLLGKMSTGLLADTTAAFKISAVLLDISTTAVNLVSSVTQLAVSSGIGVYKKLGKGAEYARREALNGEYLRIGALPRDKRQKEINDTMDFLGEHGLLNDSAIAQDLRQETVDRISDEMYQYLPFWPRTRKNIGTAFGAVKDVGSRLNAAGDTMAKVMVFFHRVDALKKIYPNWTKDQIWKRAALETTMTMPTYRRAMPAAKVLGRSGIIAPFAVFQMEVLRNIANDGALIAKYGKMGAQGNVHAAAYAASMMAGTTAKIAGMAMFNAGIVAGMNWLGGAVSDATQYLLGAFDDEDEEEERKKQQEEIARQKAEGQKDFAETYEAFRRLTPDWMRGTVNASRKLDDFTYIVYSTQRLDAVPTNSFLGALASGESVGEAGLATIADMFGPTPAFKALSDGLANGEVVDPLLKLAEITLVPGTLRRAALKPLDNARKDSQLTLEEAVVSNWMFTHTEIDYREEAAKQLNGFYYELSQQKRELSKSVDPTEPTRLEYLLKKDDFINGYSDLAAKYRETFDEFQKTIAAAREIGMEDGDIVDAIEREGFAIEEEFLTGALNGELYIPTPGDVLKSRQDAEENKADISPSRMQKVDKKFAELDAASAELIETELEKYRALGYEVYN